MKLEKKSLIVVFKLVLLYVLLNETARAKWERRIVGLLVYHFDFLEASSTYKNSQGLSLYLTIILHLLLYD
jgi:hypothetical protein